MTREEAVIILANFKRYISGGGVIDRSANEAIDMAIEALSLSEPHLHPCNCQKHIEGNNVDELMFKVPNGQNPYSTIGRYIRDNTTAIEDMIAVIKIDGVTMNELLLVDMHEDEYFVWKSDWWEGEKDIALIDFFPVSDAQKPSAQPSNAPAAFRYCRKGQPPHPDGLTFLEE